MGDVAPPIPHGKETGCQQAADELPALYLILEQELELMREPGEPMECGIFDFYKVFSRAFGELALSLLTRSPLSFNPTPCVYLLDIWATAQVVVGCCRWRA